MGKTDAGCFAPKIIMNTISPEVIEGVWSATPTPFNNKLAIDVASVQHSIKYHLRLGVKGLFVGGTCGEGPWITDAQRKEITQVAVKAANGKLPIVIEVTINSAPRIIDRIRADDEDGADAVIIAPPHF